MIQMEDKLEIPPEVLKKIACARGVDSVDKKFLPTLQQIETALSPAVPLQHLAMRSWESPELEYFENSPNQPVLASDEPVHLRCNQR